MATFLSCSPSLIAQMTGYGMGSVATTFRRRLALPAPISGPYGWTPVQEQAVLLRCGPSVPEVYIAQSVIRKVDSLASHRRDKAALIVPNPMFIKDVESSHILGL